MMSKEKGPLPPVILVTFLLLQVGFHKLLPIAHWLQPPASYGGAVLIAAGIAIVAGPALAFARAQTTIIPFQESDALLTDGMYRITRNPMYLGMLSILLGVATLCGSVSPLVVAILFVPVLNVRVIRHEEAMLTERFGAEYEAYMDSVRRWI